MSTQAVANRLVELCRQGDFQTAQRELYASDAASYEPEGSPWQDVKGTEALQEKGRQWGEMVDEFHGIEVSQPIVADPFFSVSMMMDVTMNGERSTNREIAVYELKDGKVVSERFFYPVQE